MTTDKIRVLGENTIGYESSAEGAIKFRTFNSLLNEENPWTFCQATAHEIESAVKKAAEAFPIFSSLLGLRRAAFLETIALEMEKYKAEILEVYVAESALPLGRAEGELTRTLAQIRRFAKIAKVAQWTDPTIDINDKADIRKTNVPIGPVVVFGASNFPLAFSTAGGDTVSALAAGCPVIVKAHPMHSGTSTLVAQAIRMAAQKTNMPEGVFSHLLDGDNSVGEALVKHPEVYGVGFTGSFNGGKALSHIAQQRERPIPVFAEMGSVNPVVVLPGIIEENGAHWALTLAESVNLGAGQFCTNPGLILGVQSIAFKTFCNQLGKALSEQKPSCMLHPKIFEAYEKGSSAMEQMGTRIAVDKKDSDKAHFAAPNLVEVSGGDFIKNAALQQEVFGPFSMVVICDDVEELNAVITHLDGQLTGTILGNPDELDAYGSVITSLQSKVGRLIFNGVPTGVEVCGAMQHGGPYPATTDSRFTSVGDDAVKRWVRPVAFQNWPDSMLPESLKNDNPLCLLRRYNGEFTSQKI
ncbi:aldehyde dehydrogenase family protein [Muricauda sp. JGD-17]|uniref:Aldehyde dehydrogenase family protein n=1 Tax=Flagellimonas ochracea TaxID=2696472 RepID=A0A964TEZ6_9FLAO|nr:aldehyde dehydrogenase (NADP(+)) [Allomuricauda ochracea]NAY92853.1 aldehyde dehydrogenase family protein [Allomuricauda ochracea]